MIYLALGRSADVCWGHCSTALVHVRVQINSVESRQGDLIFTHDLAESLEIATFWSGVGCVENGSRIQIPRHPFSRQNLSIEITEHSRSRVYIGDEYIADHTLSKATCAVSAPLIRTSVIPIVLLWHVDCLHEQFKHIDIRSGLGLQITPHLVHRIEVLIETIVQTLQQDGIDASLRGIADPVVHGIKQQREDLRIGCVDGASCRRQRPPTRRQMCENHKACLATS